MVMNLITEFIAQLKDINLWLDIIYIIIAYGISIGVGHWVIFEISDDAYRITLKNDYKNWELDQHKWTSQWVGILERLIITTSIIFGVGGVLVVWYGVKIISKVSVWNEEKEEEEKKKKKTEDKKKILVKYGRGRALFNIYLLGTALSLIYGAFGAQAFYWLHNHDYLYFLLSTITLVGISWLFRDKMKKKKNAICHRDFPDLSSKPKTE